MPHPPQQMHKNPQMHTYARLFRLCSNGFAMKTIATCQILLKTSFCLMKTKKIELNRDAALAEANIRRRACWFNNRRPLRSRRTSFPFNLLCLLTVTFRSASKTIKIEASSCHSRTCLL